MNQWIANGRMGADGRRQPATAFHSALVRSGPRVALAPLCLKMIRDMGDTNPHCLPAVAWPSIHCNVMPPLRQAAWARWMARDGMRACSCCRGSVNSTPSILVWPVLNDLSATPVPRRMRSIAAKVPCLSMAGTVTVAALSCWLGAPCPAPSAPRLTDRPTDDRLPTHPRPALRCRRPLLAITTATLPASDRIALPPPPRHAATAPCHPLPVPSHHSASLDRSSLA